MNLLFPKRFSQTLARSLNVRAREWQVTLAAFMLAFILMASYFVLRPIRDAMASDWSDAEVSMLWNLQFFISAGIVSLYAWVISKVRFKWVVPLVYSSFALSFVVFYVLTHQVNSLIWVEKAFYIWVSAFSLFNLSVFWSFMSDTFSNEQGKRLFALIAMGASAGAIVGPLVPLTLAENIGLHNLMLLAAVGLLLAIPLILYITRQKSKRLNNKDIKTDIQPLNRNWSSGIQALFKNPYLMGIAAFILLYVFLGAFIYFQQKNILAAYTRPERAEILAIIDWVVNSLTFIMALFFTSRILKKCGMGLTLALLPIFLTIGMIALAFAPMVMIVLLIQIFRRVGNYAITRPARELLFTQVTKDERFKSKPVIDVVVYRGGDAVSGSLFALLSEGIGMGLLFLSLIGAGISATWSICAMWLGKVYNKKSSLKSAESVRNST